MTDDTTDSFAEQVTRSEAGPAEPDQKLRSALAELSEAREALRKAERRQSFLLELSDTLRLLADPAEIQARASQAIGEHLGVNRVAYAEIEGEDAIVRGSYVKDVAPLPERFPVAAYGALLSNAYEYNEIVAVNDLATEDRFDETARAACRAAEIAAYVGVMLVKDGRWTAAFGLHTATPRDWTAGELDLIREVAERTWVAVERARVDSALRESEQRVLQFGDASSDILWIRNARTMQWEYVSPAFQTIYGDAFDITDAGNDLRAWAKLVLPEDRRHALRAFKRVRSGERVTHEFRIRRPSDGAVRWIRNTDFPLFNAEGEIVRIGGIGHDATEEKETADRMQVLVAELQHRTRNLIAVVRSLADKTMTESSSLDDFRERFRDRLGALSRVQGLLSRLEEGDRVTFDELIEAELSAHGVLDGNERSAQVRVEGPAGVRLRSGTVQTLALALHELATNALKYGALSAPDGRLTVHWHVEADGGAPKLHVEWRESGVAMPGAGAAPEGRGYGRELIERALPYQLNARTNYEMGPDGVRCTISLPVSRHRGTREDTGN